MRVMRQDQPNQIGLRALIDALPGHDLVMAEIGSFAGESAQIFLDSDKFRKIYCIDHWLDLPDMDYVEAEKEFDLRFSYEPRIIKLKMESGYAAKWFFFAKGLDLAYIDANHNAPHPKRDIDLWLPKVKIGGWIGGHDYKPKFPDVIQAVNDAFGKPDAVFADSSWLCQKL